MSYLESLTDSLAPALRLEAAADQTQTAHRSLGLQKLPDAHGVGQHGHGGLQRLLGGREQNALQTLRLQNLALGTVAYHRDYGVNSELGGLLRKPFETVDVLRGADSHREPVGHCSESGNPGDYLRDRIPGVGHGQTAFIEGSASVHHRNLVALPVAEHSDAMTGLFPVEPQLRAVYVLRVEYFHCLLSCLEQGPDQRGHVGHPHHLYALDGHVGLGI